MGHNIVYDKNCRFIFNSYVKAHDYRKITNKTEDKTVNGICLDPTKNFQESYKKLSLLMGSVFTRKNKICETPMPKWVIQCVRYITTSDRQDLYNGGELLLVYRSDNKNGF